MKIHVGDSVKTIMAVDDLIEGALGIVIECGSETGVPQYLVDFKESDVGRRWIVASFLDLAINDAVNHPAHYTRFKGIEVIQLTEQLNFCLGNAVKYIARAGAKDPEKTVGPEESCLVC